MSEIIEDGDEPLDEPVIETPVVEAPPPPPQVDPETEALARKYGWKPKAESTLPEGSYMEADRFVAASKTRVRILADQLAETDRRAAAAEALARSAAETVRRQERARYEAELENIRAAKVEAVKAADEETYRDLEDREAKLRPPPAGPDPGLDAYAKTPEGAWLNDKFMWRTAVNALNDDPAALALPPLEQAKWAAGKLKEYFPHKFAPPAPPPPRDEVGRFSRVDGGGLATGRTTASHGLSAEDYAAAQELVKQKVFKDVGEYAAYSKKLGVLE